jgi:flavin reductase (DIM6/NTAB) family NADH-FMN oxidoreductase RutF
MVNSLSGYKSANLIATCDRNSNTNVAIFSSLVHLGSSPALVGFIMRPDSVARHTLDNIKQTDQFTINHVNENIWQQAHQTAARYPRDTSEFSATGLTERFVPGFTAPLIDESELCYMLKLAEIIPIELNGTLLVIGEIKTLFCNPNAIKEDGYIDIEHLGTVAISGLDSYHKTQRLSRLSYPKTDRKPSTISINGR